MEDQMQRLKNYNTLLKVKPPSLRSMYPYVRMDEKTAVETIERIEQVYQNLVVEIPVRRDNKNKRGGVVTVITL